MGSILDCHAKRAKGYFWFASKDSLTDYFEFSEDLEVMALQQPMRNSGKVLKHVEKIVIRTNIDSTEFKVNEHYYPQGFPVSVYPAGVNITNILRAAFFLQKLHRVCHGS
jgi:hypothetical protein